ncbi:MAG: acetate--CoA ligase family protein [Chloroflexota bacterium]
MQRLSPQHVPLIVTGGVTLIAGENSTMLLNEFEAKEKLRGAGIAVNDTRMATSRDEAVALSRELGFPVVLKALSPDLVHKSRAGGVRLGLKNAAQVARGYDGILAALRRQHPGAIITGISVQRMVTPGTEVIIGMSRDPQFGPVLLFGLGGTQVEELSDFTFGIVPTARKDAARMVREIKAFPALRNLGNAALARLETQLLRVSRFVAANPQVSELDINPFIVSRGNAVAVDARIVLDDAPPRPALRAPARKPSLAAVFAPRSVAIVGASAKEGISFPNTVITSLLQSGFPAIYPVNPRYDKIQGLTCYPDLKAIPGPVDHVVVAIPAASALDLLDACAAKGVRSVHFYTAGFRESGDARREELEQAMLQKAREGGLRIIGPNSTGISAPGNRLRMRPMIPGEPGPVAFLSQSGGYAEDMPWFGGLRGLRFSKIISFGNALDVAESEILAFFGTDNQTRIIAGYIEGVRDGRLFYETLKRVATHKPVVLQKGGITGAGQRATLSHTASLTSSAAVFEAVCRQAGVIRVEDPEEMIDVLVLLQAGTSPAGRGVAVVGAGGGPSVLASDEMEKAGLRVPPLALSVQEQLKSFLPRDGGIFTNPVDANNLSTPDAVYRTACVLGAAPEIHTLVYHLGFHPVGRWGRGPLATVAGTKELIHALGRAGRETGKPVILALRPALDQTEMKSFLAAQAACVSARLPAFYSLRHAAVALARLLACQQQQQ